VSNSTIIVVGGGAAGMLAAGTSAENGARVILLEKKERLGRKLRITGKGRCNLSNDAPVNEFIRHFGKNGRFLRQAFARFFSEDLIAFLGGLGVAVDVERGGRIFPISEDATEVTEALFHWIKSQGVEIRTNTSVDELCLTDGRISGIRTGTNTISGDAVILTTGGASYPATGSTGDGYRLARNVGHTIIPARPALVPLTTAGDAAQFLQGVSLKNVRASVWVDAKKVADDFGEMLFTHFGLSGPIILTLSRTIVDALGEKKQVRVSIDLKPALDEKKLDNRILRDVQEHSRQKFRVILKGLLPGKMVTMAEYQTSIDGDKVSNQLTSDERKRLVTWLKDFRFDITGHRGFPEAIVTAGGVNLKEIDPKTMASKIVPGLFIAGELLDIDGDTGGYNLQAAFSTGHAAGIGAAEYIRQTGKTPTP